MGQIKNIKLHIVTDIKYSTETVLSTKWFTAKYGFPILVHTDLVPVNVVFVQTNMELFESTDSVFADSVSVSTPTTSVSRSSSKRWMKIEVDENQRNQKMELCQP